MISSSFLAALLSAAIGSPSDASPRTVSQPPPTSAATPATSPADRGIARTCRIETEARNLPAARRRSAFETCLNEHRSACRQAAEVQLIPVAAGRRRAFVDRCMENSS